LSYCHEKIPANLACATEPGVKNKFLRQWRHDDCAFVYTIKLKSDNIDENVYKMATLKNT